MKQLEAAFLLFTKDSYPYKLMDNKNLEFPGGYEITWSVKEITWMNKNP